MVFVAKTFPGWLKQSTAIASLLLALLGMPVGFGYLCASLVLAFDDPARAVVVGLGGVIATVLTVGTGGTLFGGSLFSLRGDVSKPLSLPSVWKLATVFGVYLILGFIIFQNDILAGLFFPLTVLMMAALPPLAAVAWFAGEQFGGLTWRRSLVVYAGGTTAGLVIGGVLQLLLALVISVFFRNLNFMTIESWFKILNGDYNSLLTIDDTTIFMLIQLVIIYPIITELIKPLAILPFINSLSRREAFLLGAIAGAGLAAIEGAITAGLGFQGWVLILLILCWGGAIHPLSSGLVALAWYDADRGRANAWPGGLAYFGGAITLRSLWNAGLLIILLTPGFLVSFLAILLLIVLGPATLWVGRSLAQSFQHFDNSELSQSSAFRRAAAIWAVASLMIILPIGVMSVRFLF